MEIGLLPRKKTISIRLLLTTAIPESSISIDGGLYQNAGANMVQQIACSSARK
jgi:methylmalonyl-CoA mutase N-terminal domain/subunit